MLEMVIHSIRVSVNSYQRVVILKEKGTERFLPIWIGPAEADSIAIQLQGVTVPRPMTHDLLRSAIDLLGATVRHILVSELNNDTFFAKIVLDTNGKSTELDSRPSDAIALAVRTKAPIYVEEGVLEKAGIMMDGEGQPSIPESKGPTRKPLQEDEINKLSAFKDLIESLDIDDLGEEKSQSREN